MQATPSEWIGSDWQQAARERRRANLRIASMDDLALDIRNVTKTFVKTPAKRDQKGRWMPLLKGGQRTLARVVDSVSLQVRRGETVGVLGQNGSGKSTLIRLVSTLLLPDEGSISVFGHDVVREANRVKRMLNRVSVEASFFKKLSAAENLLYSARLYGLDVREAHRRALEILTSIGFDAAKMDSSVEQLSRGQQQKVAIARAFLSSPMLLLMDEPTTGLDPKSKRDVQAFVKQLREEHDTTILLTTHDMAEAEELCDRVAVLHRGKVVALGTPAELKEAHRRNGETPSLEDVFLAITGKRIADDAQPEETDEE